MKAAWLVPIMAISLMGCVSAGTKELADQRTVSKIEVGKSSRTEVRTLLGDPVNVMPMPRGEEAWIYVHMRGKPRPASFIPVIGLFAGGADVKSENLMVYFDRTGIVKDLRQGSISGGGGSLAD